MNKQELINFEKWVVEVFNDGQLKSPVHLSGGNEEQVIDIFKKIKPNDWVFTTYRSHYHCLLKGVSPEWLKEWILDNKSIHVMNKEHKIWTTAIVGGQLSIALGTAMAIKLKNINDHVWVFLGDMTATTGQFWEVWNYAYNHNLPMTFVIEDNNLSTDTPTREVWNRETFWFESPSMVNKKIIHYKYERVYPHYGTGKFVAKIWEGVDETKQKGF
ncbi:MAG: hypothetical protein IH948_00260 [Bacteroidetes bacterium]|nr:hypothetical protein [Bacteroidota bacterium]